MHQPIKVAIQGDRASFHEIAAKNYYSHPIEFMYCRSFEDVFKLLTTGDAQKALVAVSNSSHGEISEVKQLIENYKPNYEGSYHLPIHQHLIGLPGSDINKVSAIISHPVALSQCSLYIEANFSGVDVIDYHDTSAAVEYVKQQADSSIVAIGSEAAARLYGMDILQKSIQHDPNNVTVFHAFVSKSHQN